MSVGESRNFGLDLIRSTAILLVLVGHLEIAGFLNNAHSFYLMGFYGVEIFFVLSGFLIGNIFIRSINKNFNFQTIKIFWIRRWFRTLPLFYIIILIREFFFNEDGMLHYLHWFFLQNILHPAGYSSLWYAETWSLAVEEWFYLLLPLLSLLFLIRNRFVTLGILTVFSLSYIIFRYLVWIKLFDGNFDFNSDSRYFPFLRIDSLLYGVILAYIKLFFAGLYKFIASKYLFISTTIIFAVLLFFKNNWLVYDFIGEKLIPSTIGFNINSFLIMLMIPYLEQSKTLETNFRRIKLSKFIHLTSLYSYCFYLIHTVIYVKIIGDKSTTIDTYWVLRVLVAWGIIYIIGHLSWKFFEEPILKYRDKVTLR